MKIELSTATSPGPGCSPLPGESICRGADHRYLCPTPDTRLFPPVLVVATEKRPQGRVENTPSLRLGLLASVGRCSRLWSARGSFFQPCALGFGAYRRAAFFVSNAAVEDDPNEPTQAVGDGQFASLYSMRGSRR